MAEGAWGKLNNRLKQYGPATLAKRIAKRGLSFIGIEWEVFLYCAFDLREPFREKALPEGYTGRILTWDDIVDHSAILFPPQKLEIFKKRLNTPGYSAVGIFFNDQLVGYAWLSMHTIEPLLPDMVNNSLQLAENEGYLLDAFSHPAHRGKGFHPFYTWWRYDAIKRSGKTYAVTIIDEDNRSARTAQAKSGFKVTKKLILRKNFGKQYLQSLPSKTAL
jgi:hypothetical protein